MWTLPSRDAVQGGSAQSAAQHKSDNQDKSQEVEDRGENTADPSKESPGSSGDASRSGWDARRDPAAESEYENAEAADQRDQPQEEPVYQDELM